MVRSRWVVVWLGIVVLSAGTFAAALGMLEPYVTERVLRSVDVSVLTLRGTESPTVPT